MTAYHSIRSLLTSKMGSSVLLASIMMTGLSAHAMLPTPEPAIDSSINQINASPLQQSMGQQGLMQGATNQQRQITTKTVAALVSVDAQGNPALKPIDANTKVQKGNVIEYRTYVTNASSDRMRSMTVNMTIPNEVKLVGEVSPSTASASVDGNNFSRMPLRGRINGQLQDVPLEYYKNLRWKIEGLGINETAVVKYRAIVR